MTEVGLGEVRKRKAFLLTDVVGSTRLWELDPASMSRALVEHDRLVRDAVARHAGVLVKSKGEGDSTFSVFAKASNAAAAALDAQAALAAHAWPSGTPLQVRMAIHVGDAGEREGDYFGPTVNRTARLRGIAGPAEVVVSQAAADQIVRTLPPGNELLALGPRELRDLTRPEQPYLLRSSLTRSNDGQTPRWQSLAPLPEQLAMSRLSFFVGRDHDLDRLGPIGPESADASRVVLVGGDLGIGKTRFVAEAGARLHDAGWTVVFGRAEPDVGVPYAPLVDALRAVINICPPGILTSLSGREVAALELLAPQISERVAVSASVPPDQETERDLLLRAVPCLLAAFAAAAPLVIVLDDLHNAAQPALLLLRQVICTPIHAPLLVIGTYRDTELGVRHPLSGMLADLRAVSSVARLTLGGLSEEGVGAFLDVAGYQRDARSSALARAIHDESDGNPLFIGELLAHLADTGVAYQVEGRWVTDAWSRTNLQLPAEAREVLYRRLDHLSGNAKQLVEVASVIGREFPYRFAEQTASHGEPLDPASALDALDEAIDAGILVDHGDGTCAFTSSLVRQTILAGLRTPRRAQYHLWAAEVLSNASSPTVDESMRLVQLAHHYFEAGAPVQDEALRYALAAADAASKQLAFEDAAGLYERTLDSVPDLPANQEQRIDLLIKLGQSRWRAGEFVAAGTAFRRAADIAGRHGLTDLEARAALGYGGRGGHRILVAGDSLVDLLRRVRSRIPPPSAPILALVTARLAEALTLEPDRHESEPPEHLAVQAVRLARETRDDAILALVLLRSMYVRWTPENPAQRLRDLHEIIDIATRLDDADLVVSARILRESTLVELAATDEALKERARAAEWAGPRGDAYSSWLVATVDASRRVSDLAPECAEPAVWEALALGRRAQNPSALQLFGTQMFVIRREQGRLPELHAASVAMVERHPMLGFPSALLALLYSEAGLPERAREELDRLYGASGNFDISALDVLWLGTAAVLAEVCVDLNDRSRAGPLYEQLRQFASRLAPLGLHGPHLGSVSHHVGRLAAMLGFDDDAHVKLRDAVAINDRIGAQAAAVRSRLALAQFLMDRGDRSTSLDLLARVAGEAEALGLAKLTTGASRMLDGSRRTPGSRERRAPRVAQARATLDQGRAVLTSRGRSALGRILGDASDEELQRRFGPPWAQRVLFQSMVRGFQPAMAFGFEGDITFELLNLIGLEHQPRASWWTISVRGRKATARRGAVSSPAASVRLALPDLIRMVTGAGNSVAIVEEGRVEMEGDVLLIARLTEMFGGVPPLPISRPSAGDFHEVGN